MGTMPYRRTDDEDNDEDDLDEDLGDFDNEGDD
jgi:hypothetical protein